MWASSFFYIAGVCISRDWKNPRKGLRVVALEEERGADWFLHGVVDMQAVAEEMELALAEVLDGDNTAHRKARHTMEPSFYRSKAMKASEKSLHCIGDSSRSTKMLRPTSSISE